RDTRPSGAEMAAAVMRGVRLAGGTPVDVGIAPTPTICFAVSHCGAAAGVIITASHNPLPYNGYKMVHGSGRLFSGAECERVYEVFRNGDYPAESAFAEEPSEPAEAIDAVTPHIERILSAVKVSTVREAGVRVAVDSINGAAGVAFPVLLEKLGVAWRGVHNELDGNFVHNPEPRPEHLTDLAALLAEDNSLWGGFAFDPDADRLAPMAEAGGAMSEEMTFALALENVLERERSDVVTNLSTSMVIDDVAREYGVKVVRTPIGEANVVAAMREGAPAVGGEGNGGVIYPRISTVRDGLTALALIIELMARRRKRLGELAGRWPVYPIIKEKITLGDQPHQEILDKLASRFANETVDRRDGLKIIREYGWVHLRPSNTEPIMRCYAEARTEDQARDLARMVMERL
ncbi:MAG: phosphoglucosamine mutase, partial [Chitinivibrionales bacterium]|nr:phosphoglucosamine mutase [Chitinivibrionales bacterium]MBD3358954.1 phosphoglucosamine mutase [Chitinivibrionales bacterium]